MNRNIVQNSWNQSWHHAIVDAVEWDIVENNWKQRWHHAIVDAVEAMDWDIVEDDWNQTKGKVKQQWSKLTNDQLDMLSGRHDELVDKIQECYGVAKYEAERQVKDWGARNDAWFDKAARRIQKNAAMWTSNTRTRTPRGTGLWNKTERRHARPRRNNVWH